MGPQLSYLIYRLEINKKSNKVFILFMINQLNPIAE